MDMDIDALLSSIQRGGNYAPDDVGDDDYSHQEDRREQQGRWADLQALTRAWVNERSAPELLPYPHDLVARVMARVGRQVSYGVTFHTRMPH